MSPEEKSVRKTETLSSATTVRLPLANPAEMAGLARIDRKLRWMTVAMFAVALALLLNTAAIFGYIVDFHAGEGLLVGSACGGGVAMGFVFGWLAHAAMVKG